MICRWIGRNKMPRIRPFAACHLKMYTVKCKSSWFWVALCKNSLLPQQISITSCLVVVHSSLLHTFEICYAVPLETKDLIQRPLKATGLFPSTSNGIWIKPINTIVCNNDLTSIVVFRVFHKTFQNSWKLSRHDSPKYMSKHWSCFVVLF